MRSISFSPLESKIQTSIFVALAENSAKLVPLPSHVAPKGYGRPSLTRIPFAMTWMCPEPAYGERQAGSFRSTLCGKRLIEISDDVVDGFDAHGQAHHVVARSGERTLLRLELAVRGRSGVDDQAAHIPNIGEMAEQLHRVHQLHACTVAPRQTEG